MKKLFSVSVFLSLLFLLYLQTQAEVPQMINYQGKLTTPSGGCLNDTVQMTFAIYPDTNVGTSADWTETQDSVVVKDGVFSVLLGSVDSIPASVFDGNVKYLGVQVESDPEMRPLKPMVSVAYAYRAGSVNGGAGGGWVDDGTVVRLETGTDSVGIGTTNPTEKLDVIGNIHASGTITSGSSITIDGANDKITASSGTIDFDDENLVTTGKATIGPGHTNTGTNAFVAGRDNTASWEYTTVGGGYRNTASGGYATVGGGYADTASGEDATVGGGYENVASGIGATVGGGIGNTASGSRATVGGGTANTASGWAATIRGVIITL
ncbi:MAG: hypothetical protein KAW16_02100 [candidate division Zixibacteria bacterium]|nr:hypothetical protein [candidate division Zixibacteria bacterium]